MEVYISLVCIWVVAQSKQNAYTYYELLVWSKSLNPLQSDSTCLKQR